MPETLCKYSEYAENMADFQLLLSQNYRLETLQIIVTAKLQLWYLNFWFCKNFSTNR